MTSHPPSRKSQFIGSGALLFLVVLGAAILFNMWLTRKEKPPLAYPLATPQQAAPVIDAEQATAAPESASSGAGSSSSKAESINVWFSDPLSGVKSGGPENHLVEAINGAKKTVDIAIYNLSLDSIGSALIRAKSRGVQVRLVMESEAMDKRVPQSLLDAKIPIVGDQREGLMHNKFAIIDGGEVWMGSMNYTSTSSYDDFNNLVRFDSQQLAADYETAFDEMFTQHQFGPDKAANTPYPSLTVAGVPVEVYFSPDDGISEHVAAELRKAKKSILFLAYSFTSDPFARAIRDRAAAGVTIRGVFDKSQVESNEGGEYAAFKKAKYDVKMDGIPGLLHDKVFIIDNQVVITGSYNFSLNAERTNDENLVIIRDAGIAAQYLKHFEQVYGSAK